MTTPPTPATSPRPAWRARLDRLNERRWFRWGRDLLLVLVVLAAAGAWQTRGHLAAGVAPDPRLTTLDGAPASLQAYRGKPVLIAFWAPWCTVCKAESGNLAWAQRLVGDRAHVISVATAFEDVAEVRAFVAEQGLTVPVLLGSQEALRDFRLEAFPTAYFLDAEGRVTRSVAGYTTTAGLVARLLW